MTSEQTTTTQPGAAFIRSQGISSAVINMVVNPALAWLLNRNADFLPVLGGNCIAVDTAITSLVMSLLMALIISNGVQSALKAGAIKADFGFPPAGKLLALLPRNPWALGFTLGFCAILILLPVTIGLFNVLGWKGLSLGGFMLFKAIYTGPLAYGATYCIIMKGIQSKVIMKK